MTGFNAKQVLYKDSTVEKALDDLIASPIEGQEVSSASTFTEANRLLLTADTSRGSKESEFEITDGDLDCKDKNLLNVNRINFNLANEETLTEGQVAYDSINHTLGVGLPNGSILQVGQENVIRAKAIGSEILNGKVAYIVNSNSAFVGMSLANNTDAINGCNTIAIATQDINENAVGFFTTFGIIHDVNTNAFNEGDILYLSVNGGITNVKPVPPALIIRVGYCIKKDISSGEILVSIHDLRHEYLATITKEPTGFDIPENVIITGDSTTRKVTLSGTNWTAYYQGLPNTTIINGYVSPAHGTDTTTQYFLLYNGSTTQWYAIADLPNDFYQYLLIAFAFYNTQDTTWIYQRECHGLMDWRVHKELHTTTGTYSETIGSTSSVVLNSTTAANRRPAIASSVIYDEDLKTTLASLSAGTYTTMSLTGATGIPSFTTNATDIVPLSTNNPYYNSFNGSEWVQTLINENNYMAIWLIGVPMCADVNSQKIRYIFKQGTVQGTLATIQALKPTDIEFGTFRNLTPEFTVLKKYIIRYTGGNWTIVEYKNYNLKYNNFVSE